MTVEMTGGMILAVHEAREACKGEPDIIERIRKAMRPCLDHWMEPNDSNRLRAAIGAALLETESQEEKSRIVQSFQHLGRLSAALSALQAGVPVDLEKMAKQEQAEAVDIIPIMTIWHEETEKKKR